MTKSNRATARELKHLGLTIQTTQTHRRGQADASRDAQAVRNMFHDSDTPIALVEHELLKLRRKNPQLFRELREEFGMEYMG